MLKPLPTSTATFRGLTQGGYLYVDKTEYIYQIAHPSKGAYFLARPRRFGKNLFLEKQIIILVDEYDNPLLDNLDNLAEAKKIRGQERLNNIPTK